MRQLLESTGEAIVLLDEQLYIRRFTSLRLPYRREAWRWLSACMRQPACGAMIETERRAIDVTDACRCFTCNALDQLDEVDPTCAEDPISVFRDLPSWRDPASLLQ